MHYLSSAALAALLGAAPLPALAQDRPNTTAAVLAEATAAPDATTPVARGEADADAMPLAQLPLVQPPPSTANPNDSASLKSLVGHLGHDLRRAATPGNAWIVVGFGAAAALAHPYDAQLTHRFSTSRAFERVLDGGQVVGGTLVQVGGSIATFALGRALDKPRVTLIGADMVRAQLLNTVFTQGLKLSLNRSRPDGDPWSFPSGHSSGTFASATVLQRHLGWKVGVPAYAVAAYVAGSRLQERRHYASDVIFGAGLGIVSGRAVTVGRGANRFAMGPMSVPGGAGVTFTRLEP